MPEVRDLLDAFLIGAFLFGLVLTTATLLLGVGDLGAHGPHGGHPGGDGHDGFLLPFGLSALLVCLTWIGGLGFMLRRVADWPAPLALAVAAAAGVIAGALVQRGVRALSDSGQALLDPERYRLPGSIGHVSSPIRAGGVGEVVYEQAGVRQVVAARA
ncbi:MAG: hypothetical protein IT337_03195, partial [Thermomicrobiales bacterium]|nr:hypothetical protein [Thermomicrobiales bacterium]